MQPADDLQEIEAITLKGRYPLSVGLAKLPQSSGEKCVALARSKILTALPPYTALILAVGSTDRLIQIFTRSESTVGSNSFTILYRI